MICEPFYAWVNTPAAMASSRKKSNTFLRANQLDGVTIRGPITPLGNFCLVKTKETLTATDGGILLPDQVSKSGNVPVYFALPHVPPSICF